MLQVFSHAVRLTFVATFETLCCVVEMLLLMRAGSLPSCARNLSGLRQEFLRAVGKLMICTPQREGILSGNCGRAFEREGIYSNQE